MAYGVERSWQVFKCRRCRLLPVPFLSPTHHILVLTGPVVPSSSTYLSNTYHTTAFLCRPYSSINRSSPATYLSSHHITKTLEMSSSSTTSSIVSNLSISAATAVSRSWDCACGPSCALFIDHRCASQSGAAVRLVLPGVWMVALAVLVCWFVLVGGTLHEATGPLVDSPQNDDAKVSFSTATTSISAVNDEPSSTTTYHLLAAVSSRRKSRSSAQSPRRVKLSTPSQTSQPPTPEQPGSLSSLSSSPCPPC